MSVSRYIFDKTSGAILHRYTGPADQLDANIPPGCSSVDAQLVSDPQSQRIDVKSFAVVDWQPPRPDADHFWDPKTRRWLLNPIVIQRRQREQEILVALKALDDRLIRTNDELLDDPNNAEAIEIRSKIKQEKDKLRHELRSIRETV